MVAALALAEPEDACVELEEPARMQGKVAMVWMGGGCDALSKVRNAQQRLEPEIGFETGFDQTWLLNGTEQGFERDRGPEIAFEKASEIAFEIAFDQARMMAHTEKRLWCEQAGAAAVLIVSLREGEAYPLQRTDVEEDQTREDEQEEEEDDGERRRRREEERREEERREGEGTVGVMAVSRAAGRELR
eukprot:3878591-Rhodomonas_salina.1